MTGVKMVHVPYAGSHPQAVTDLLAGRVQVFFSPASTVLQHVRDGKLVALASTEARRAAIAPDLPTMAEAGLPGFETGLWFGLVAPAARRMRSSTSSRARATRRSSGRGRQGAGAAGHRSRRRQPRVRPLPRQRDEALGDGGGGRRSQAAMMQVRATQRQQGGRSHAPTTVANGCARIGALRAACAALGARRGLPARPVRIVVGFIPGSSADITARVVGQRMGQILGQQFVVESKPGAGSSLAAEFVARAPKDGYTLFLGSSANITNAAINPSLSFDMAKDFAPIALVTTAAVILVVHPSVGVNSLQELMALAKAKPGEVATPRPASAPPRISPASCSRCAQASSSCTCPTREARRR